MRFSFDLNYSFGNSETKRKIYAKSRSKENLDDCMESGIIVCKSLAYICEYILKNLGINIKTESIKQYGDRCAHIYNTITSNDGKEYMIDLQQDLQNIQSHSRTEYFGIHGYGKNKPEFTLFELEQIDKKIGYISPGNYYSNDYLYLLKSDLCHFENFEEKLKFVLENIDIYENKDMKYAERKWHHTDLLSKLFNSKEFAKIHFIDCYEEFDKSKNYKNCIVSYNKKGPIIYMFSEDENKYCKVDLYDFAKSVKSGKLVCKENFPRIKKSFKGFG